MGFERIAAFTWRHPRKILAAIGLFMVAAALLGGKVEEHLQAAGFGDSSSESERAIELLRDELGYDAGPGVVVLVRDPAGDQLAIGSRSVRSEVARLSGELGKARFVAKVDNPLRDLDKAIGGLPPGTDTAPLVEQFQDKNPLIADEGRSILITGHLNSDDPESDGGDAADDVKRLLHSDTLDIGFAGFAVGFSEVEAQAREDLNRAELIAFPVLAILLLIVFRGLIAAAVPLLIGVASILGTFLALRIMSEFASTSLFALNITTALSLGLAVDYALLMISRYREELEADGATEEAHRRMVTTAGRTVVFSGITVAAALAALMLFPQRFLYSVGAAGAIVGVLASTIALFGVSALVAILGERINKFSIRRGPAVSATSGGWYRLAHGVMRRPKTVALASAAGMLLVASPALSTDLTGPSAEAVPRGQDSFPVQERINRDYERDSTEPITVTVSGDATVGMLKRLNSTVASLPGVTTRTPFLRAGPETRYANFGSAEKALDDDTQQIVREIRSLSVPGADVLVAGNTARFLDQKESLASHLPAVVAVAVAVTLLLLFLLTGSIILPIKTLVMNGLTLAAVLGILTLGFQEGWLDAALSYEGPAGVELMTLALVFAITFGLATDYAVLVMARIKEQHDLGVPNREAVAIGIGRTGRVITAAAMMLAVVFAAFATSEIFFMKQAAVAQATGVLIDATIVRALLVPSLMALLGEFNWWAPGPLKRFQKRFGFSEG